MPSVHYAAKDLNENYNLHDLHLKMNSLSVSQIYTNYFTLVIISGKTPK